MRSLQMVLIKSLPVPLTLLLATSFAIKLVIAFWVDGVLAVEQASGADPLLALDGGLTIGGEPPSANSFGGLIDNVAVWSSTIPEGDIFALANGATPLDIIPEPGAGLLALLSGLGLVFFKRRRR